METTQLFTPGQLSVIESIVEDRLQKNNSTSENGFVPVDTWCKKNSISKSKLYAMRADGLVRFYKFGSKNVFLRTSEIEELMKVS